MSDEPEVERNFSKPPDYSCVYADGVILQSSIDVSRLIFFQKEIEPSADGKKLQSKDPIYTLKFEVRIPHLALIALADNINDDLAFRNKIRELRATAGNETKALNSWGRMQDAVSKVLIDTDKENVSDVRVEDFKDRFEDLQGRAEKASRGTKKL